MMESIHGQQDNEQVRKYLAERNLPAITGQSKQEQLRLRCQQGTSEKHDMACELWHGRTAAEMVEHAHHVAEDEAQLERMRNAPQAKNMPNSEFMALTGKMNPHTREKAYTNDADGDMVPNAMDCFPYDPKRQGKKHKQKTVRVGKARQPLETFQRQKLGEFGYQPPKMQGRADSFSPGNAMMGAAHPRTRKRNFSLKGIPVERSRNIPINPIPNFNGVGQTLTRSNQRPLQRLFGSGIKDGLNLFGSNTGQSKGLASYMASGPKKKKGKGFKAFDFL